MEYRISIQTQTDKGPESSDLTELALNRGSRDPIQPIINTDTIVRSFHKQGYFL